MLPQRVIFGQGSLDRLPEELEKLALRSVLLIASASSRPFADDLADRLGVAVGARIHQVRQHVPEATVGAALELVTEHATDGVVTIGGGSATGLGKAVAIETGLSLVAVPTTYAGSEVTPVYGVTGEHKRTGRDARAMPTLVVYDARLTTAMPAHVTATSGLNAVAHCVEAMYAPGANPVTSLIAEEGVKVLADALPRLIETSDDLAARDDALYGAYLAGSAMSAAGTALHHTLCHVIGGTYGLGHGDLHALLLPHVAAYNALAAPDAMVRVARALGSADAAAGLAELGRALGAPTSLAALGMPIEGLDDVAERAVKAIGDRNPRPVDLTSLRVLLDDAYTGRPPGSGQPSPGER